MPNGDFHRFNLSPHCDTAIYTKKISNNASFERWGAKENFTPIALDGRNGMQQASVAVQPKLCQGGEDVNGRSEKICFPVLYFIGNEEAE